MKVFVSGVAGFIGFHVARELIALGHRVVGVDNLNSYYDTALKRLRLQELGPSVDFENFDITNTDKLSECMRRTTPDVILHLAAQAGVRHSIDAPFEYSNANIVGHLSMLEAVRQTAPEAHLVYASSSSVYGASSRYPFREDDPVDSPVSLYGATKRSAELISASYASLYGIQQTGLRFFTVYGSWGRPDMAYWLFTAAILRRDPIKIFNNGRMSRDMTHISDVVQGILSILERPPNYRSGEVTNRIYNIGRGQPEPLLGMVEALEKLSGEKAHCIMEPMAPGDVRETYANIDRVKSDYGFSPRVDMADGLAEFFHWYKCVADEL